MDLQPASEASLTTVVKGNRRRRIYVCAHETSVSLGNATLPCPWMAVIRNTHSCSKNPAFKRTLLLKTVIEVWVGSPVMGIQKAARNNDVARLQETRPMSTTNPMSIQQECWNFFNAVSRSNKNLTFLGANLYMSIKKKYLKSPKIAEEKNQINIMCKMCPWTSRQSVIVVFHVDL